MIDSPTVSASASNYAVVNPLWVQGSGITASDGNLSLSNSATYWASRPFTIAPNSGKWYVELTPISPALSTGGYSHELGVLISSSTNYILSPVSGSNYYIGNQSNGYAIQLKSNSADYWNNAAVTTSLSGSYAVNTSIMQMAIDIGAGKGWFGVNNSWIGGGNPATGSTPTFTFTAGSYANMGTSLYPTSTSAANFGQRPFSYTPPTGFNALNTYNLPAPSIANGAQYMAATTYTANGGVQTINNGTNNTIGTTFQPDLVWTKPRSNVGGNIINDSVRGASLYLTTNTTNAELTDANYLTSFNSNGFSLGSTNFTNGYTMVGWQWKAGGTGVTNNSGTITSTVSANPTAGFSVVTFTAQSSGTGTVGHGLGVAPSLIITKPRANAYGWTSYHESLGNTKYIELNTTSAASTLSTVWNNTSPTSTVFTLGSSFAGNGTYVAYCFAAVSGYSAFGSYTGNGSSDGPFVFTNFRPRWIMLKNASSSPTNWFIFDTSRDTYNVAYQRLFPSTSDQEYTNANTLDFLSNGFKIRDSSAAWNGSGNTIIYAAFAESPFKISRAR
jgi:hypothetical protein